MAANSATLKKFWGKVPDTATDVPAFQGIEGLYITGSKFSAGLPWGVENGKLLYEGQEVIIEGLNVFVKELG